MKDYRSLFIAIFLIVLSAYSSEQKEIKEVDWIYSTPEAQGISSRSILKFIDSLETKIDAVHSFMIIRHGKLVSQGWWDPYGQETPHVMHSLSKSFTSTAIGFAVKENLISLDDLVIDFFPYEKPSDPGWQLKEMRIRDLLTMSSGHRHEPWPGQDVENWAKNFLESDVEFMPGTHFQYNSQATYMLSRIIQNVSGDKLVDFLDPRFFQPLKILKPEWDECPQGYNAGGWGLHIRTEDIAKLGQFYLQKGNWNGEQLLPVEWVNMATSKQTSNGSNPDNDWAQGYGFQFWRCRYNCYRGDGSMGQFCIVMPEQDAVVAITSGANDMAGIMNLVWEILLPAMENQPLTANSEAFSGLQKKTADLKLKPVSGDLTSPISKQISRKKFQIEENEIGIKSISFNIHGKNPSVDIEMGNGTKTVAIGTNEYQKGEMDTPLPYTDNLEKKIAVSGAWTNFNEYTVRIYFYESPARATYTFLFEGDEMIWGSKLNNALFGRRDISSLKGRAE